MQRRSFLLRSAVICTVHTSGIGASLPLYANSLLATTSMSELLRALDTLAMMKLWRREVACSIPDQRTTVGCLFSSTSNWYGCLSFKIMNLFGILSPWGSSNYRPSAPFLCEVVSHVKSCHFGDSANLSFRKVMCYSRTCCASYMFVSKNALNFKEIWRR